MFFQAKRFAEFRKGRIDAGRFAAKATTDILWHLDAVAGPGGAAEAEDPEYAAFRDWFQQRCAETHLGLVSRVLACMGVDETGAVQIHPRPVAVEQGFDRVSSRVHYLCKEIASLQERYGQLFPDEVPECEKDMQDVLSMDLEAPEQRGEVLQLLGELERWYAYAQQGMRLFRNDADARAEFDEVLERLLEEEAERKLRTQAIIEGEETGTAGDREEARSQLLRQKESLEVEICEYQEHLAGQRKELEATLARLSQFGSVDSEPRSRLSVVAAGSD